MANTDNSCANLDIKDYWRDRVDANRDTLGDIMTIQAQTQKMHTVIISKR